MLLVLDDISMDEGHAVTKREWIQIRDWGKPGKNIGWIPRDVAERIGLDCSPLDQIPQGTVWIKAEQGEKIRKHREFQPGEELL